MVARNAYKGAKWRAAQEHAKRIREVLRRQNDLLRDLGKRS